MKVIFDRSAFHGDRFTALRESRLRMASERGLLSIILTPTFLDETVPIAGAAWAAFGEWREHLQFALDVANGGIFRDKQEIWHEELVMGRGSRTRYLMPRKRGRRMLSEPDARARLRDTMLTGRRALGRGVATEDDEEAHRKKNNQRAIMNQIRADVSNALREGRLVGTLRDATFAEFREKNLDDTGREFMDLASPRRPDRTWAQWRTAPCRYPVFTAFVEGVLYQAFHAAARHNEGIDRNAQADYEQLCYLTQADAIVSNDMGFMKSAFDELWQPRGKRFWTCEEFVELVDRWVG